MDQNIESILSRIERIEGATASAATLSDDATSAFDTEDVIVGNVDEALAKDRRVVELDTEEAILHGGALVEEGAVVSINAASLGHAPSDRGRKTGPDNRYWRDYCSTTRNHICYGPYHKLNPGVYVFRYEYRFQVPVCGGANDTVVFEMDTTQDVGKPIPGSKVWVDRWKILCKRADENNIVDGFFGGRFAIAEETRKVEMRIRNRITRLAGMPFELVVRQLRYWKE